MTVRFADPSHSLLWAPPSYEPRVARVKTGAPAVSDEMLFLREFSEEGFDGILHEAGDGHRTYTTWNRRDD